ncbi:MAG TPA: peroxiredoxin [Polyangiales bacterium]
MPTSRKPAPSFSAPSSTGQTIRLEDYRGRYLVLYFYPASFTYGCTRETVRFRDATAEIESLGAGIVGVSPDTIETQCRFAEHYQAKFPIVSDPDNAIARQYGVVFPLVKWIKRVTFVIDPEGSIAARFHHELMFEKHIDDAIAFLKSVGSPAAKTAD